MKKKLRLLMDLIKGNTLVYIVALLSIIPSNMLSLTQPLVIGLVIDSVIGDKPMDAPACVINIVDGIGGRRVLLQKLWLCVIILTVIALLNGIFAFIRSRCLTKGSEDISRKIRNRMFDKFQRLPYDYHVKAQTGDLVQRCTSDVETVRKFMSVQLVEIWNVIVLGIVIVNITIPMHLGLTIASMVLLPVIMLFSFIYFVKIRDAFKEADEADGRLSTVLQENLTGVRVVRAFARQKLEQDKFTDKNLEYKKLQMRLNKHIALFWSLSDVLCGLQLSIAAITGIYLAATGEITLGTYLVFMSYESMFIWPVRRLGRTFSDLGKMSVSIGRINEILAMENEDMMTGGKKPEIKGNIEFKNVCFGYDNEKQILKDISFSVKSGQTIALLGSTGSGKSTLIHLLHRLYDNHEGSITIEGVDIKEIDKKWLRQYIGLVLQEPFLFSRSIKDNIGFSKRDAKDEEIIKAARIAAVHSEISEFEKGYDTIVGERGVTLSGGQKQRVAIARSVIRNCPILIFDDSLSAVDTVTDAEIRKELAERTKNVTAFIVSHRISTLSQADMILVLEDGRIIQKGTHTELLGQEGLYRRIWELQSAPAQAVGPKEVS